MKTTIKTLGTVALFFAFSMITSVAVANTGKGENPAAELKYLGIVKNNPVFRLDVNSKATQSFTISIKDIYGNVLYSEKVKGGTISRTFQLDTDQVQDEVLKVEVKGLNTKAEVFTINRNSRYVDETSVSKL